MSEASSGEPGHQQDRWSRPADFGEPGSVAPPLPWPGQPASGTGLPPPSDQFSPAQADPWPAPPGGPYPPPGALHPPTGQYGYPQTPGQYPPGADQYGSQASPGQYPPGPDQHGNQASPGHWPPGAAGQSPPWPYYPTVVGPRNSRVAIAALVCGLGQFVLGLTIVGNILLAIPAVICGAIGLRQTNQPGVGGRGMAIAGLVLGILGVVYFVLIVVVLIVLESLHHSGST